VTKNTFSIRAPATLQVVSEEREAQSHIANQQLQTLITQYEERERRLQLEIEAKERETSDSRNEARERERELEMRIEQTRSNAREAVETQLRALAERERVFAADLAHVKALVDEERRLLRSQYLSSVSIIRSALNEMPQRRFWRNIARKLSGDAAAMDPPQVQAERQIHQKHNVNTKINTIEELLSLGGHDFIKFAYLTLLGRRPDAPGYAFYMEQLESSGDKAAIICQVGGSGEARQNPIRLKGLEGFMRRQKWRRLPIIRSMLSKPDYDPKVRRLRRDLEDMDLRIAAIDEGILSLLSQLEGGKLPSPSAQIEELLNSFDDRKYDETHPEIALATQKFVLENLNEKSIGARYAKRLEEIRASRVAAPTAEESDRDSEKVILGNIDSSTADQCVEASDTIPIEGWMASPGGIDTVEIYVDSTFVADAHYGVLRPDVHDAFPLLPNAGRSGFCYLLNIADLADGNHSFSVIARCRSGISRTWTQRFYKRESSKYQEWLQKSDELYMSKIAPGIRRSDGPFLTLVLRLGPVIDKVLLRQTLSALAAQRNSKFELICLMQDGAQQEIITGTASSVNLIAKCQFLVDKTGIWPSAIDQCRGKLIGLVDVGDVFRPWAFSELHESIRENGLIDLIYADEDFIDGNGRNDPTFKPGWSPIFLDNYNYIGRPWFASRTAFSSAVSTLSSEGVEFDEHQLLKAIGHKNSLVGHIPTVLLSRSSRWIHVQGQAGVRDTITESGLDEHWPKVSIIVPTRLADEELIAQCFDGLESNTDYPNLEVIVVVNNVRDPEAEARHLGKRTFKVLHWDGAFNWAGINNLGATRANGELFLFLNDDIEPLEKDWLKILVQTLVRAGAAAIGGLLRYPNGTIQHSGVHFVNYDGGARHLFRFCAGDEARLGWLMNHPREVSAVTGACLLTTRECFNAVNGFDEEIPLVGNDTDYCLRVWRNGSSVMVQPAAKLIHHEGVSRQGMSEVKDVERFRKKWAKFLEHGDFFSNPNLDVRRDDWTVNPSIEKTFKLRSGFSTDQNHSRGIYALQNGLFNVGEPANLQEETPVLQVKHTV
jgi:GT2 family glycosyltransferase